MVYPGTNGMGLAGHQGHYYPGYPTTLYYPVLHCTTLSGTTLSGTTLSGNSLSGNIVREVMHCSVTGK